MAFEDDVLTGMQVHCAATIQPTCSVRRAMAPAGKSLEDQVREIQKLLADARETLAQAEWALETLVHRIRDEEEQG